MVTIAVVEPWFNHGFTAEKTMKMFTPKPWLNHGRTTIIFWDIESIIEPKSAFSLHIKRPEL